MSDVDYSVRKLIRISNSVFNKKRQHHMSDTSCEPSLIRSGIGMSSSVVFRRMTVRTERVHCWRRRSRAIRESVA